MPRALRYIVMIAALAAPSFPASQRTSWSKIRYIGGTIPVKAPSYDFDTTLTATLNPDIITVAIAPAKLFAAGQNLKIPAEQVISLSAGAAAWRRVGEVSGAQLPAQSSMKTPSLFGLSKEPQFVGIVYQMDNGNRGALLLQSVVGSQILGVLERVTGKTVERAP